MKILATLLLSTTLALSAGCQTQLPQTMPLAGTPTWLPIGGEVYHVIEIADAEQGVLEVGDRPRWFLPNWKQVTKSEWQADLNRRFPGEYVKEEDWDFLLRQNSEFWIPLENDLARTIEHLPTENHGVYLQLGALAADAKIVTLTVTLASDTIDLQREVEHRWTNTLPLLFAFFVDGKAAQLPERGFSKSGGVQFDIDLLKKGDTRRWTIRVDAESLRKLLPNNEPHSLQIVAAFCNRQHEHASYISGILQQRGDNEMRIVVRSEPKQISWTGWRWIAK